eukprot:10731676-Lingulodinium_polyedra.AAC.1
MAYEESENMCADIYTKVFTDNDKLIHACELIGIFDPEKLCKVFFPAALNALTEQRTRRRTSAPTGTQ